MQRVLLIHETAGEHEWEPTLYPFAGQVTHVTLDNPSQMDLLDLPAGCAVFDARSVEDFDKVVFLLGGLLSTHIPVFLACREAMRAGYEGFFQSTGVKVVFDEAPEEELSAFLEEACRQRVMGARMA